MSGSAEDDMLCGLKYLGRGCLVVLLALGGAFWAMWELAR